MYYYIIWKYFYFLFSNSYASDFSCLIALAHTSSTIISYGGDNRHPCLVLILVEMPLVILHIVDAGFGLRFICFIIIRKYPSISIFMTFFFIRSKCWILSKAFSASMEIIIII